MFTYPFPAQTLTVKGTSFQLPCGACARSKQCNQFCVSAELMCHSETPSSCLIVCGETGTCWMHLFKLLKAARCSHCCVCSAVLTWDNTHSQCLQVCVIISDYPRGNITKQTTGFQWKHFPSVWSRNDPLVFLLRPAFVKEQLCPDTVWSKHRKH